MFSLFLVLVNLIRPDFLPETGFVSWIFIVEAVVIYICQDYFSRIYRKFSAKNIFLICFCGGYITFGVMKLWMGLSLPNWCGILFGVFGGLYLFFCPMALLLASMVFDYVGWIQFPLDVVSLMQYPWFYVFGLLGIAKGVFYAKIVWSSLTKRGKKPPAPPKKGNRKGNAAVGYAHER